MSDFPHDFHGFPTTLEVCTLTHEKRALLRRLPASLDSFEIHEIKQVADRGFVRLDAEKVVHLSTSGAEALRQLESVLPQGLAEARSNAAYEGTVRSTLRLIDVFRMACGSDAFAARVGSDPCLDFTVEPIRLGAFRRDIGGELEIRGILPSGRLLGAYGPEARPEEIDLLDLELGQIDKLAETLVARLY